MDVLSVSTNGRYLVDESDNAVFLMADDAWSFATRLTFNEARTYLQTRKTQGFNCLHIWLMSTWSLANRNNDEPFASALDNTNDPSLDSSYWNFFDTLMVEAESQGMYIMLSIGSLLRESMGSNNVSNFGTHNQHRDKAYKTAHALASRLRAHTNIMYTTGTDMNPLDCDKVGASNCASSGADYQEVVLYMGKGLADGHNDETVDSASTSQDFSTCPLITWHPGNVSPNGSSSSGEFFHTDSPDWCSINMRQGGRQEDPGDDRFLDGIYAACATDYARSPAKPMGDGEVAYENSLIPDESDQRRTAYHSRVAAYWSIFAGSTYHCYGALETWQHYTPGLYDPRSSAENAWTEAIDYDGAQDMGHLKALIESRPVFDWVPDQTVFDDSAGSNETRLQAIRNSTGQFAMVYITNGKSITADMTKIAGTTCVAWWFDPRTRNATLIGEYPTTGTQAFDPPGSPTSFNTNNGNDYVLVLDNKARNYPQPGTNLVQQTTSAVIGHRGSRLERPENILVAMQYTYNLDANLEMDVRLSSDDVLVLMHDSTVDRTTDLTGNVSSHSAATLAAADAGSHFDAAYSSEGVPSLATVIADMMTNAEDHIFAIVDTKDENTTVYNALQTILNSEDAWNRVFIEVSDDSVATAIRSVDSRFRLMIWAPTQAEINSAIADGRYERIATHDTLAQLNDEIQAAGIVSQNGVHTVEEWCDIVNSAQALPDAIHTDAVSLLTPIVRYYGLVGGRTN